MADDVVWGYEVRQPYDSESAYFNKNTGVAGMASSDGRIVLNPFSPLARDQQHAVAQNEAARLFMRDRKFKFDFDPTPEQRQAFRGTAYESDGHNLRATLLARFLSGDPSAGQPTQRQREWVDWLRPQLEGRRSTNRAIK